MNIFFVNDDPRQAAVDLADKHVGKMMLEAAQMLFTAVRQHGYTGGGYASAYANHPMTKWVAQSYQHATWLLEHALELASEFERRFGKRHKTASMLPALCMAVHKYMPDNGWRNPPRCIPDEFKLDYDSYDGDVSCHVASYRGYYRVGKAHLHKWTHRPEPEWLRT